MAVTKEMIIQQIQQDTAAYDALSEALKEVLLLEAASLRAPATSVSPADQIYFYGGFATVGHQRLASNFE
jgi:hypothetical protein